MANKSYNVVDAADNVSKLAIRLIDNGDGTYSLATAGSGGGVSTVVTGNVASGATDSGNPVKVGGVYNTSPPTLANGQRGDLQVDVNANLRNVEQYAPTAEDNTVTTPNSKTGTIGVTLKPVSSADYAPIRGDNTYATQVTNKNEKSTPGSVFSVQVFNFGATLGYFQLHNKATAPAGADVPMAGCVWPVPPGTPTVPGALFLGVMDLAPEIWMSTGISWALSTTLATFTDALTAANFIVNLARL